MPGATAHGIRTSVYITPIHANKKKKAFASVGGNLIQTVAGMARSYSDLPLSKCLSGLIRYLHFQFTLQGEDMRRINKTDIGKKLIFLMEEKNPIDEDIEIIDEAGSISGVIISEAAYRFFLEKVEEEEDAIDGKTVEDFHKSREMDNEK